MEKLQYDSFYKFLVSVGVILVTGPFFGIYYLLSGAFDIKVSAEDFSKLASESQDLFLKKTALINNTYFYLPYILYSLILIGFLCLIWGGLRWFQVQKIEDEGLLYDTGKKFGDMVKALPAEIVKKLLHKLKFTGEMLVYGSEVPAVSVAFVDEAAKKKPGAKTDLQQAPMQIMGTAKKVKPDKLLKMIEIEDACLQYYKCHFQKGFVFLQGFQLGNFLLDIVAKAKRGNKDMIYEIQYLDENDLREPVICNSVDDQYEACRSYNARIKRNARPILTIVTIPELSDSKKREILTWAEKVNGCGLEVQINFIKESELYSVPVFDH